MFYGTENGKVWMTYPGSRILDRGFAVEGRVRIAITKKRKIVVSDENKVYLLWSRGIL